MLKQVRTIAYYTWLEALKNRMLWLAALLGALAFAGSLLFEQSSVIESRQVGNAFLAASSRICAVFMLASFIIVSMVREACDKTLEYFLSLDLPRASYLLGKLLGFGGCAALLSLLFSLTLLHGNAPSAVAIWGLSLFMELMLMATLSLFCVLTFNQVLASLTVAAGFYLFSRSIGTLILLGNGPLAGNTLTQGVIDRLIEGIAFLFPRLDLFTQTSWLVYSHPDFAALLPLAAQTAAYLTLAASAALFDFYRKSL